MCVDKKSIFMHSWRLLHQQHIKVLTSVKRLLTFSMLKGNHALDWFNELFYSYLLKQKCSEERMDHLHIVIVLYKPKIRSKKKVWNFSVIVIFRIMITAIVYPATKRSLKVEQNNHKQQSSENKIQTNISGIKKYNNFE